MRGTFLFTHSFVTSSCEEISEQKIPEREKEWVGGTFIMEIGDIVK